MEILKFFTFDNNSRHRLEKNECRMHYSKETGYSITLNCFFTQEIISKGFRHLKIGENSMTGELFLVFQGNKTPETLELKIYDGRNNPYSILNGKQVVGFVATKLGYRKDECNKKVIRISDNISRDEKFMVYKISRIENQNNL